MVDIKLLHHGKVIGLQAVSALQHLGMEIGPAHQVRLGRLRTEELLLQQKCRSPSLGQSLHPLCFN